MEKRLFISILLAGLVIGLQAQLIITSDGGQPHTSAYLEVRSFSKGFMPPKLNTGQRDSIAGPATGLMIYNSDCHDIQYFNGTQWIPAGNQGGLAIPGSIDGPEDVCIQSSGHFFSVQPAPGATGYQWIVPEGASITSGQGTAAIIVSFGSVSGWVAVSALNDCYRSLPVKMMVNVSPYETVGVTVIADKTQVCQGQSVTLTASPLNGGTSPFFQWKKNGVNITGANGSVYSYIPADNDQITCQVVSSMNCVNGNPAISVPVILTVENSITRHHSPGTVAPVQKTVTYELATGVSGEPEKCWISRNLGASQQPASVNDATESSAGWYWQFNRKQGFMHSGSLRTPSSAWITPINENSDWVAENDPCMIELGTTWRVPTLTEWTNVSFTGSWNNWNGPFNSPLKLHAAGFLDYSFGTLQLRGSYGAYWSQNQTFSGTNSAWFLNFVSSSCIMNGDFKATAFTVRCVKE